MIKKFCDFCGEEMTGEPWRVCAKVFSGPDAFKLEVLVSKNGVANTGDVCRCCVIRALDQGESAP